MYRQRFIVSLLLTCTYCKSLWIKASAKCPQCKYQYKVACGFCLTNVVLLTDLLQRGNAVQQGRALTRYVAPRPVVPQRSVWFCVGPTLVVLRGSNPCGFVCPPGQAIDSCLSETGVQQAEAAGRYLRDVTFTNVFVSNMLRARQVGFIT